MKIAELIENYDSIVKRAFIPNPQVQQDPSQGAAPQGGAPGDQPPQGGAPGGENPLMAQIEQAVQQMPPEAQQQIMPALQQIMQLPPEQQQPQLEQIAQQLGIGGDDPAAQGGDPAQQGSDPSAPPQEATDGNVNAENQLDNTQVTLTVRELLDLISKGSASASLMKVKQMAHQHNAKMQQLQNKQKMDEAAAQQQQQAQEQGMMSGGIYPQAMSDGKPPATAQPSM